MSIAIFALLIPIIAILGGYYVKLEQMKLGKGLKESDKKTLDKLAAENADLKSRVENLETIITSLDKELLALQPVQLTPFQIQKKVEDLAIKLEKKSD
jgi:hypothetical protein